MIQQHTALNTVWKRIPADPLEVEARRPLQPLQVDVSHRRPQAARAAAPRDGAQRGDPQGNQGQELQAQEEHKQPGRGDKVREDGGKSIGIQLHKYCTHAL